MASPVEGPSPAPHRKVPRTRRRQRRPGRFLRFLRFSVGFAWLGAMLFGALVAALVGWVNSDDFQRRITTLTELLVERETGEQATVTSVKVYFLPPSIAVEGFNLWHQETDETIASAERIRIPLVLRNGGVGVGRLQLQHPVIQLHVEEDGKLRELQNRVHPNGRPLQHLPFDSVEVTDASIRVWYPVGEASVEDLDLTPVSGPVTDVSGDLEVTVRGLDQKARLDWKRVVIGPDDVSIPDLVLRTPLLDVDGPASIHLDGPVDVRLTGDVRLDELTPALVAPRAAHGNVAFDLDVVGPPADPTATLVADGQALGLDMPGVFTPLLTYELGSMVGSVVARKAHVTVQKLEIHWGEEGILRAWGEVDPVGKQLLDGHLVGSRVSLAHLLRAFDAAPNPWIDFSADMEATVSGPLQPLQLEGPFEFAVAKLQVGDRPIDRADKELMLDIPRGIARGKLTLYQKHIVLDVDHVETPRNRGDGVVDIGFGPRGPLDMTARLYRADLKDFQPLRGVDLTGTGTATGHIWGPFNQIQLDGDAALDGFSVLGIPYADHIAAHLVSPHMKSIELHDAHAVRGKSAYHGDFAMSFKPVVTMDTDVEVTSGRVEDVSSMFVDLPGMKGDLTGTMSLHGPLYDLDGRCHLDLANVDLWGEHFPTGQADGYMDKGRFTLDDMRVLRNGGTEGLVLRGSVERAWKLDMELLGDGLELARWDHLQGVPITGKYAIHSHIANTLFDPSPNGRMVLTDVRYAGTHIDDSVLWFDTRGGVATYSGLLEGGAVTVDGTVGLWGLQPYHLVADLQRVPAHVFWPIAADGQPVRAIASGKVELSGHFGETWSPVDLRADLGAVEVAWDKHDLTNPVPWHYEQQGRYWKLDGFSLRGGQTDLAISGTGGDTLALAGSGKIDLDLLRAIVPGLERADGSAAVKLEAEGSRPDVHALVTVDVGADVLRYAYVPITFEDVSAELKVTSDRIDVVTAQGSFGGGTFTGGGSIDSVGWVPKRYQLHANAQDAQVKWVESLPAATGDADLSFDGPVGALLLSGDVTISDMAFSDRIDWEDWVVEARDYMLVDAAQVEDEESYFNMNVAITADHTIFLRNNLADGVASADLRIIGDTVRPGLLGTVTVDPGALAYLQDREFRVDRGQLRFADPWTWDPDVDFDLATNILNQDQTYRVNYAVNGPFSNWTASSRSDPFLPQADVNALLWFGLTTDQLEAMGQLPSAVVQATADLVLKDIFLRSQAGTIREELPDFLSPDRIDIATGVNTRGEYSPDPRLVVEKKLDELGNLDVSWEMNLARPEDNYVRAEKRIGGIWSLSGWYSTLQRDRVLPIGGAYGVDVSATWESQ